jgi:hypothetical protein
VARAAASSGPVIGFYGTGEMEAETMQTLVEEFLEARPGDPRFLVPVTTDTFTENLGDVIDMAASAEIAYETVSLPTGTAPRAYKKFLDGATKSHKVEDPGVFIIKTLAKAANAALFCLVPSEEEISADFDAYDDLERVILEAFSAGVKVYDLTDALAEIEAAEEDEAESPEEAAEGAEEEESTEDEEEAEEAAEGEEEAAEDEEEEEEVAEAEEEVAEAEEGDLAAELTEAFVPVFAKYLPLFEVDEMITELVEIVVEGLSEEEEPEPEPAPRRGRRKA